ncbi:hypothetical protein H4R27_002348 [Coemansia aciculifera]|nr:hypothetical protein H4R27_002348 [Coemansia aciculifera]
MSLQLSSFQILPMLIVHKVVEYLEGRARNSIIPNLNEHNKNKAVLTPLLSVSESWRMAALVSICDNCTLDFEYSRSAVEVVIPAWPADFSYPGFRKTLLVKRVVVTAKLWKNMCDGLVCKTISRVQYEGVRFPSASTLVLLLTKDRNGGSSSDAAISPEMVACFARTLRRLTPAVVRVKVEFSSVSTSETNHAQLYDTLVSELCHGSVKRVSVHSTLVGSPLSVNLRGISELTGLTHGRNISCVPFARLAYLNAPTLKTLKARPGSEADWTDLIYGGTTIPTSYTSLRSLTLAIAGTPYSSIWEEVKDIAPFPVLSTLGISGSYPFDDDLLFRGNGGTMKTLRIPFSAIARNVLGRFGVLKRRGVTRMIRVCIDEVTEADREFLTTNTGVSIERPIHNILDVARSLSTNDDHLYKAICNAPNTAILQHLDFDYESLDVRNIIDLLVALPSLASLTCGVGEFEESTALISANERPNTLHAKHYPLSTNFRMLRVPKTANSKAKDIAYAAMPLAVLCPNFTHVDISPNLRNDFGREIIWAAFSDPFEPYSDSLRRLVYKRAD